MLKIGFKGTKNWEQPQNTEGYADLAKYKWQIFGFAELWASPYAANMSKVVGY